MKFISSFRDKLATLRQDKEGLYQFIIRSAIFFGSVFFIYMFIFMYVRHLPFFDQYLRISQDFYFSFLTGLRKTDFINAVLFGVVAFIITHRKTLLDVQATKRKWNETLIFASLSLLSFVGHYWIKYVIGHSGIVHDGNMMLFTLIKYGFIVLFIGFAAVAIYTREFLHKFVIQYWKSLLIFTGVVIAYFTVIQLFQHVWYSLSFFVSKAIYWLLTLTFSTAYFAPGSLTTGPRLGAEGFIVGVSNECSGIDSLLLFISLYVLLFILDFKRLHTKRMLALFIPGLMMTVAYNIVRIYLLLLVGIFIDRTFAIDTFHSNAGWILFLVFFMIFWHYGSKWVYKRRAVDSEQTTMNGEQRTAGSEQSSMDGEQKTVSNKKSSVGSKQKVVNKKSAPVKKQAKKTTGKRTKK